MDYYIRALTIHASRKTVKNLGTLRDEMQKLISKGFEAADKIREETGIRTGTIRVTLPDSPQDEIMDLPRRLGLDEEDDDFIVSIGNVPSYHPYLEDIVKETVSRGIYTSILFRPPVEENSLKIAKIITSISLEDVNYPTRVGVNLYGHPVYTPYYPLSSSPGDKEYFSLAVTYPNYLYKAITRNGVRGAEKALENIIKETNQYAKIAVETIGFTYIGLDLSLSPWMEDSVARIVEYISGSKIPQPGTAYGIYALNSLLDNYSGKTMTTGFNEIQLPLAEDNVLKERAREGVLSASDLSRLSGVCLAGLDLVPVPADIINTRNLLLEVFSYSLTKNRPLGARIIAVEAEPGDTIRFEKFGEATVIPYHK